jgi:thiol-disulfide isomerase/thioredoxin
MRRAAVLLALLALGCENDPKKAAMASVPKERAEALQAPPGTPATSAAPVASAPASAPSAPSERRKLCEGQLAKAGKDLTKKPLSRKGGAGPMQPVVGPGQWTLVNLWAAWCAPCKEEMPRLNAFRSRLASVHPMRLSFISLDDDERQLDDFLAAQPADGVRETYWLREGHERDDWLAGVGLPRDASLPVQLLFDRKGKLRCVVNGALDEGDFQEIASIVSLP